MACYTEVQCPACGTSSIKKCGITKQNKQRYHCKNGQCSKTTFLNEYTYKGSAHDVPAKVISMDINGSGIRDTGRVLGISPNTVTNILRSQADKIQHIHPDIEKYQGDKNAQIQLCLADLEAEMGSASKVFQEVIECQNATLFCRKIVV